jgi:hypothetical protein
MVGQDGDFVESAREEEPFFEPRPIIFRMILAGLAALIFAAIDFSYVVFVSVKAMLGSLLG